MANKIKLRDFKQQVERTTDGTSLAITIPADIATLAHEFINSKNKMIDYDMELK